MNLRTLLLVTDDPDDHQAFSEALSEISSKTVVLIILDSEKALRLLQEKKYIPDYLVLDLSMNGIRINSFLKAIRRDEELRSLPAVIYGDVNGLAAIDDVNGLLFFSKEYEYSELKSFLSDFLKV
jgi:CheY-like chemotaxis protein